jgi:glycine cleavage system aminomethyltransferase T
VEHPQFVLDGRPTAFVEGDTVLAALLRSGSTLPGCLCLAGDCPHCLAVVDGVAYTRVCRTGARPGMVVETQPVKEYPVLPDEPLGGRILSRLIEVEVAIVGGGETGLAEAERLRAQGRQVIVFDDRQGEEVVGIYPGPELLVRTPDGIVRCDAHEVVVATGSAEIHPVCPGNQLAGIFTAGAVERLSGVDLGRLVAVGTPPAGVSCLPLEGRLVRFEGTGRVESVVMADEAGVETSHPCDAVSIGLGRMPRDVLARMAADPAVRVVGDAASPAVLPPCPAAGVVCPCSDVTVADLESVWERGFHELELVKRSTLAGTGTCQGVVCMPHVRSFLADRGMATSSSFTARPLARQMTMAEAAAGWAPPAFRRTALDAEHRALGARMDRFGGWWRPWRYGDPMQEYWAVRQGVSIGDVGTLGKMIVSGPDVVEFLERVYPGKIADLKPGRSRYVLILAESGGVLDDGMVCRDEEHRFTLTFTSGGASFAEAWLRDWAATFGTRVHILDRTHAWGAINVTGPFASELLARAGVEQPLGFMAHTPAVVAGVPSRIFRLSFTGEASFEVHHPRHQSVTLWRELLRLGQDLGIKPHGIDTLFTLRLEKGHIIVGMDTESDSTPRRLGLDWAVKFEKPDFIGRQALLRSYRHPLEKRSVGLVMEGPTPEEGSIIRSGNEYAGYVTSSRFSPVLGHPVMLGWVATDDGGSPVGDLSIDGRAARVASRPFYDPEGHRARA